MALAAFLLAISFTQLALAYDSSYPTNISIHLEVEKTNYAVGDTIVMRIVEKNVGTVPQEIELLNPERQWKYRIKVTFHWFVDRFNSTNQVSETEAPITMYGRERSGPWSGSVFGRDLNPGEEYVSRVHLNRLYDMTMARKYSVVLQSTTLKLGGRLVTRTNLCEPIEIVLTDPVIPALVKRP